MARSEHSDISRRYRSQCPENLAVFWTSVQGGNLLGALFPRRKLEYMEGDVKETCKQK